MTVPDVSVIIVSYNTSDLLVACLESVLASQGVVCEAFVVDNASHDGSAEIVRSKFPSIHVIANSDNRGFGTANNQALRVCNGRYVVFLNPDTTVEENSFKKMIAFMDKHPEIGLAGPRVLNPDGSQQESVSFRYPGHRFGAADLGQLPGNIACVLGACQIASRELLQKIGGFDEDFFLYGEDQDICLRIRKLGLEIGYMDDVTIMHHGGKSERTTPPAEVVRKKIRGEYLFYSKHYRSESIERLLLLQRRRSSWRIFFLRLRLQLMGSNGYAADKLARYQVIREEAAFELEKRRSICR